MIGVLAVGCEHTYNLFARPSIDNHGAGTLPKMKLLLNNTHPSFDQVTMTVLLLALDIVSKGNI